MSDNLRTRVIEAGARGIAEVTGDVWELYLVEAESTLDAMLDCLAEAWYDDPDDVGRLLAVGEMTVDGLIGALWSHHD